MYLESIKSDDKYKDFMLTDKYELNFIEILKFVRTPKDINNPLHRWLLFLEDDVPKKY